MEGIFITILDLLGTFAFAISGIRLVYLLYMQLNMQLNISGSLTEWMAALVVLLVRVVAEKFNVHLPVLSPLKEVGTK